MITSHRLTRELRGTLRDAGLSGSFLVRDLHTGDEIAIDAEVEFPTASLVKVPLAVAFAERIVDGRLNGSVVTDIAPAATSGAGQTGLSRFRHSAQIAIDDLLYLSTAISDNVAADVLFGLVSPAEVHTSILDIGVQGIAVRHSMHSLSDTPADRLGPEGVHLAHALAIGSATSGRGHAVSQLDVSRANSGTARAYVDLLQALWMPSRISPHAAMRVRSLMRDNVIRHRLAPDFSSDASIWSSKTGTLLNLRHEVGVVEHDDGGVFAVAAFTESSVPAAIQPAAEAVMARAARTLHDHLRM